MVGWAAKCVNDCNIYPHFESIFTLRQTNQESRERREWRKHLRPQNWLWEGRWGWGWMERRAILDRSQSGREMSVVSHIPNPTKWKSEGSTCLFLFSNLHLLPQFLLIFIITRKQVIHFEFSITHDIPLAKNPFLFSGYFDFYKEHHSYFM